jgi:hypothetical protein
VNWEAISAIGQFVGAIAVVISLIYLVREIRSNAHAARLASVGTLNRSMGQLAQNLRLAELWNRGVRNYESLEGADRSSFDACLLQLFHIFAEMYYQQVEGHLDPHLWQQDMRVLVSFEIESKNLLEKLLATARLYRSCKLSCISVKRLLKRETI